MRLWSIHTSYLDSKGLVALWREGLLAQKVLLGDTKGYKNHPQLLRFKNTNNPAGAIASYLRHVSDEAKRRGYNFDRSKIINKNIKSKIPVTDKQVEYEFNHLLGKLQKRDPNRHNLLRAIQTIKLHPVFVQVSGNIEYWEKVS
ncbi:MAG: pyrimidine dimer DNA glycosylase/endonuclease V [Proteobacteria bacterium]|nr:pyrimidine dimer DNA glycosylase/endonuclease V [Pseudomonadota bacterium]MBU1137483.1 pyrimidine dimer DNA glycosylase/endonuclease V [Pseudomonadota bacterium]MBU1234165.1 pyrimidine dimer DNA glycosylase/endonuclease V [Pseudomonadota bacterium]MBU1417454.1 pyrimidine dimer DNA glycosylase/endonuclease V [Pseudomonadota bacterium]MBU1453143.1 pyrimidine dimer DNA glycosylase/endonuclease V [Pseudomonadota bacterium]